jgi:hypothetical protein
MSCEFSSINTSHVIWSPGPVITRLEAENLTVYFTLSVDVLMRLFYLFFFYLISDDFIILDSVASNGSFEGNDLEEIWKEAVLAEVGGSFDSRDRGIPRNMLG